MGIASCCRLLVGGQPKGITSQGEGVREVGPAARTPSHPRG